MIFCLSAQPLLAQVRQKTYFFVHAIRPAPFSSHNDFSSSD